MSDSNKSIEDLMEAITNDDATATVVKVEGKNIDEVIANLRASAPEGVPAFVLGLIENTLRQRMGEGSASESKSDALVIDHWEPQERDMMVTLLGALIEVPGYYERAVASADAYHDALRHMMHCKKWEPEKVRPMIQWMLQNPTKILTLTGIMATLLQARIHAATMPQTLDEFSAGRITEADRRDKNLDVVYPCMAYLVGVMYDHVSNLFEEGIMLSALLSYAGHDALIISGMCKDYEEARKRLPSEQQESIVSQLIQDKKLPTQMADAYLRGASVMLPAKMYLIAKAQDDNLMVQAMDHKIPDSLVTVLDAMALLVFGVRDTKKVLH